MRRFLRPHQTFGDERRAGIIPQFAVWIKRRHGVEIGCQQFVRRASSPRLPDALDPGAPFTAAAWLGVEQAITAGAGVGVDHSERGRLAAQMFENSRQHEVFMHVGEIAGMECVLIVHRCDNASRMLPRRPEGAAWDRPHLL
jgi:hypothetical protein